jgi:integrase
MIFDKNEYRVSELQQLISKSDDELSRELIQSRIDKTKKRPPEYHVKYCDPFGKWRSVRVPDEYRGFHGAKRFEALKISEVEKGTHSSKDVRKVKVKGVTAFYLDKKMRHKRSYSSAKTLCSHIDRHMGEALLETIDLNPQIIVDHFNDFPEDWAPKYIWNYYACLRAAINYWIKMKRLHMANPLDLVEIEQGTNVNEYVPTQSDFDAIYMTSLTLGLPDYVRGLYVSVFETGLRIGEILGWRIEGMDLRLPEFDKDGRPVFLPYFTTEISKQGKLVKVKIPMSKPLHQALVECVGERKYGRVWEGVEQSKLYHLLRDHKLLKEAGVPFTRPFHDFRKTVKHRLKIEKGLGREISKGFMGHKTDAMDDYYTHLKMFDLWSAVKDSWKQ